MCPCCLIGAVTLGLSKGFYTYFLFLEKRKVAKKIQGGPITPCGRLASVTPCVALILIFNF
jgi:hypothetical protein